MKRKKKFAEGGGTEDIGGDEIASARADMNRESDLKESARSVPKYEGSFKDEFAKARSRGDATFQWKGKRYTTEMASSKPSAKSEPSYRPGGRGPLTRSSTGSPGMARQSAVSAEIAKGSYSLPKPDTQTMMQRQIANSPKGGKMSRSEVEQASGKRSKYDTDTSTPGERLFKKAVAATPKGRLYARGGSTSGVPRPPKGEKYDAEANDWMAGEMEVEAEKERRKAKPAPKAPPKAYARGGAVRGCGCESRGKTRGMIR